MKKTKIYVGFAFFATMLMLITPCMAKAVEVNNNETTKESHSLNEGSKFYGCIYNSVPNTYHEDVKVKLVQDGVTKYETTSGFEGYFEINNIEDGKYRVKLSKPGLSVAPTEIFHIDKYSLEFPEDAGSHIYQMSTSFSRSKQLTFPALNSILMNLLDSFPLLQQLLQRLPALQ